MRDAGIPTLEVAINTAIEAVNSAYDDFKPINDSCAATYEQTRAACGLCVEGACTARYEALTLNYSKSNTTPGGRTTLDYTYINGMHLSSYFVTLYYRAKIVCDPEWYERLLMETMLFFEGDFPDFFTQDIPLAANVVGGGIVTGAVVIGDGFVDFGNIVGDGKSGTTQFLFYFAVGLYQERSKKAGLSSHRSACYKNKIEACG